LSGEDPFLGYTMAKQAVVRSVSMCALCPAHPVHPARPPCCFGWKFHNNLPIAQLAVTDEKWCGGVVLHVQRNFFFLCFFLALFFLFVFR
jgi:hypothetical protein